MSTWVVGPRLFAPGRWGLRDAGGVYPVANVVR